MGTLFEGLTNEVTEVVEAVGRSVVGVGASGSGVVVGTNLVVTNAHNLRGENLVVSFGGDRPEPASVAGADPEGDLAVLSVDTGDATPAAWSSTPPRLGELVVALAQPGGRGLRVGVGFVSALEVSFPGPGGRRITGAVEHTAPLTRGSSGGPVVNGSGELLGIDTHRVGDGFYLALPASEQTRARIDSLSRGEPPKRVRLGVALAPPRVARRLRRSVGLPERDGLLVHAVEEGGPADRAGIRQGDLIVSVAGSAVGSIDELAAALDRLAEAGSTTLDLVRGVEEVSVAVDFPT